MKKEEVDFPCPHCLVKALTEGLIELGEDPEAIIKMVMSGLKDGLEENTNVTVLTNFDQVGPKKVLH